MGQNNDSSKVGGGVGLVAGLMAGTVFGLGLGLLLAPKTGAALRGGKVAYRRRASPRPWDQLTEADREREEVIEALLHPDRSRHDELGRTEDVKARQSAGRLSPREQGAAPIDMTCVGE